MTRMLLQRSLRPLLHRKIRSYIPRPSHPPEYKFPPDLSPPTLKQQFRQLLDPNLDYNIFRFIECIQPAAWSDSELSAVLRKINDQGPQLMVSARATAAPQSLNYHDPVRFYILACGHLLTLLSSSLSLYRITVRKIQTCHH